MDVNEVTSACQVRMSRAGDVLVMAAMGVVRRSTHELLRAAIHAELRKGEARAVVVDFRGCVSALSDEDRHMMVRDSVADPKAPLIPVGMVVPENLFEPTVRQCAAAWSEGRLWVPFLDYEDALHWARTRRPSWRACAPAQVPPPQRRPQR